MGKLLNIAIPTKNRQEFLIPLLDFFLTMDLKDVDIIIQDNSDDESQLLGYLKDHTNEAIHYYHKDGQFSQMENSEFAIENCDGKYVCFIGDDDYVSRYLIHYVKLMDDYKIECSIFQQGLFMWPGLRRNNIEAKLTIGKTRRRVKKISVKKEYAKMLRQGAMYINKMPQLYQGVVLREKLEEIKRKCGHYFPGPSPDMAVATALCYVIENMVYCDVPLVSSGQSIKSAAGLGIQHSHKGKLGKIKMLPANIEERWLAQVPKIWTGPTIYAQSANEALVAMGDEKGTESYNWNYFYAAFINSNPEYDQYLKNAIRVNSKYKRYKFSFYKMSAFVEKVKRYLKAHKQDYVYSLRREEVKNSYEAGIITDDFISGIALEDMFKKEGIR